METPSRTQAIGAQRFYKSAGISDGPDDGKWGPKSIAADRVVGWVKALQTYLQSRGWYSGKVDGILGPLTALGVSKLADELDSQSLSQPAANAQHAALISGVDDRSAKNIATLLPKVQTLAVEFLKKANSAVPVGYQVKVISGTRTYAEQDALYAQGRTKPGSKVTNARAGYSNHNFGVAFDVGIFQGGKYLDESWLYSSIAPIGKSVGLNWGGDWKSIKDEPHYEYPTGQTLAEMRARVSAGKSVL